MSKKKFSNGGYTGKVSKESTAGIIQNSGCCCGFVQGGYIAEIEKTKPAGVVMPGEYYFLDEIHSQSKIKTVTATINEDGTMSKTED